MTPPGQLALWSGDGPWFTLGDRFASIPPPPPSGTRIRLGMLRGKGKRNDDCRNYSDCLRGAIEWDDAHCPDGCASRDDVGRAERVALALDGLGSTPLAEARAWSDTFEEKRR